MTRDDVIARLAQLVQHTRQEQELRDELRDLDSVCDSAEGMRRKLALQRRHLREIETLRQEKVLPLVEEMLAFIARHGQALS